MPLEIEVASPSMQTWAKGTFDRLRGAAVIAPADMGAPSDAAPAIVPASGAAAASPQ